MLRLVFLVLGVTLYGLINVQVSAISLTQCNNCTCPRPNKAPGMLTEQRDENQNICYCECGVETDGDCVDDGHCKVGTTCASADTPSSKGKCRDMCLAKIDPCNPFHKCVIENNRPACKRVRFQCDPEFSVTKPVTGHIPSNNFNRVFQSLCHLMNANYDRALQGDTTFYEY